MNRLTLLAALASLLLTACGGSGSSARNTAPGNEPEPPRNEERTPIPVTQPFADHGTVLNILPPGQDDNGGVSNLLQEIPGLGDLLGSLLDDGVSQTGLVPALIREPHFDDQLGLYEDLAFSPPGLTDDQLTDYFKAAPLLPPDAGGWTAESQITSGDYHVDIRRDTFGVPHIFGASRLDALFGMGYVTAQDRLFLLDVLRRAGRGELSKFLGPADFSFDLDIAAQAPYREADRTAQIAQVASALGEDGAQIFKDATAFVDGLNKYVLDARSGLLQVPIEYVGLGVTLEPFVIEDVVAIATLIQGIFAGGGGAEHENVLLLHELAARYGDPEEACALWRDLRHANDPESSVTTETPFATQSPATINEDACPLLPEFASEYPGAVMFDAGSFVAHNPLVTEPCGRPGQVQCPGVAGGLPALPLTGVVEVIINGTMELLRGLLSLSDASDVVIPLRPDGQLSSTDQMLAARTPLRMPLDTRIAALDDSALWQAQRSAQAALAGIAQLRDGFPATMSNALLVNGEHTASGHPIAVFGPQTSYFVPQLLLEMAVHGGDLHTRGMTFTGLPYVVIGRGPDFAWSATSGNSDLTDVKVLPLCAPGGGGARDGYIYRGRCVAFDVIDDSWSARWNVAVPAGDPLATGQNVKVTRHIIRSPDIGPVLGYATVNGQAVALVRQRSTYFAELDTALPFLLATRNEVFDAQSFREVFNLTTGSFNWFYIDDQDISFIHAGLYPRRAEGVHPELPSWGDGRYDWQGFLSLEEHPQDTNPARGFLASWNNRPAPDWWSADDNASYQLVHRNDMLEMRLEKLVADGNVTRGSLTEAMGDAAVTDLRGQEILPAALALLQRGTLTSAQQEAVFMLHDWVDAGAPRRDRDNDGQYDRQDAVALMDAWYPRMIEQLLPQILPLEATDFGNLMPVGRDNKPGVMGSAYQHGYYGYLRRVLDMANGDSSAPYRALRCAGSDNATFCRAQLLGSLDQALTDLGGIDNRESWQVDMTQDSIEHRAIGLAGLRPIHWQNRPTFQQVVEFTSSR